MSASTPALGSGAPDAGRCCFWSDDKDDVCGTCVSFEHANDWCNESAEKCEDCGGTLCALDAAGCAPVAGSRLGEGEECLDVEVRVSGQ